MNEWGENKSMESQRAIHHIGSFIALNCDSCDWSEKCITCRLLSEYVSYLDRVRPYDVLRVTIVWPLDV